MYMIVIVRVVIQLCLVSIKPHNINYLRMSELSVPWARWRCACASWLCDLCYSYGYICRCVGHISHNPVESQTLMVVK